MWKKCVKLPKALAGKILAARRQLEGGKLSVEVTAGSAFNGLTGYTGSGELFVQVLPAWQNRKEGSYSLKLMCSFMAAGNDKKSFSSRLCVPETAAGKVLAESYRAKLMAIKLLD